MHFFIELASFTVKIYFIYISILMKNYWKLMSVGYKNRSTTTNVDITLLLHDIARPHTANLIKILIRK